MANLVGQYVGRYHIIEQYGQGGMATVYRAYDTRLERNVAVKVIRTSAFPAEQIERILKRFEREAKALARLSHPNIVGVIDYGEHDGAPYLVMEYLPGGSLKEKLGSPMSWQEATALLIPIARALASAHAQNIIHRDVKPSNIMITSGGEPMLTDFGIAKMLENTDGMTLTGTGVGIGTPEYMAPEQWTGEAGPGADIYSLGIVLYELVTGRKPYTADTPAAVLLKQSSEPLPRPRQFAPGLPVGLEQVLFKALAKNPAERYARMEDLAAALEKLLRSVPVPTEAGEGATRDALADAGATADALADAGATGDALADAGATGDDLPGSRISDAQPAAAAPQPPQGKPEERKKPRRKGLLPLFIGGGVLLLLVLAGVILAAARVCPPAGSWLQLPWCPVGAVMGPPDADLPYDPYGRLLLEEDFEERLNVDWLFACDPQTTPWILDRVDGRGVFHSQPPAAGGEISCAEVRGTDWRDYTIVTIFKFHQPDRYGVHYFNLSGRTGQCPPSVQSVEEYNITVIDSGIQLRKSTCDPAVNYTLTEVQRPIDPGAWHRLDISFHGSVIQVWLDGELWLEYTDSETPLLENGDLWLSTFGEAEILFDDLLIYAHTTAGAVEDSLVEMVWARHILVDDEATAREVLRRLEAQEDWEGICNEVTNDSATKAGNCGDLGWFERGMMIAEFETAAFELPVGAFSDPVQTAYGWHIIQVLGHEQRLPSAPAEEATEDDGLLYIVREGDNCQSIAAAYGIPVAELIEANGLDASCMLTIGQVLRIPIPEQSSPAGEQIVFISEVNGNDDIFRMNADGTSLVNLTASPGNEMRPDWSPDGSRIAFEYAADDNTDIYVIDADGSNLTRLTDNPGLDGYASWAPDGTQIAFVSERDGNQEIYVMNADGSGVARLTDDPASDYAPDWSPDFTRIVFVSDRSSGWEIHVMGSDGSNPVALTRTDDPIYNVYPAWSPDGSQIAFASDRDGNGEIYLMNDDGSGVIRLTDNDFYDGNPAWSPDGARIVFRSDEGGNAEIHIMDRDGGNITRLTWNDVPDFHPDWSR